MEWLAQNWVWLAFAAVMILMMRRGGAGGCCGGGHGSHDGHDKAKAAETGPGKSGGAGAPSCCAGQSGGDKHAENAQTKPAPAAHGHTH